MKVRVIYCDFADNTIYFKTFNHMTEEIFETPLYDKQEVGNNVYLAIMDVTPTYTIFKFRKLVYKNEEIENEKIICLEAYHVEDDKFYNEKTPEILNYINEVLDKNAEGFSEQELKAIREYANELEKKFSSK